jgi:hypothetical protein
LKNKVGRPLKFKTPATLQKKIDAYFASCWEIDPEAGKIIQIKPYVISGLACFLDTTRETLLDYQNLESRKEYSDAIKKAKMKCQAYAEEHSFGNNAAGAIFNLKCNYKYREQPTQVEVEAKVKTEMDLSPLVEALEKDGKS